MPVSESVMNFHPLADIFPLMEGPEFEALVADIAEHGQQEPISLYEGMILDGRNRWRACERLGLVPQVREWEGDDPEAYVISLNLHRRHLTKEQRDALIKAKRRNGWGYQKIADMVGVSIGTAYNVAGEIELFKSEKLPGDDGKMRPTHYQPRGGATAYNNHAIIDTPGYDGDEWYTPREYVAAARVVMGGIDLDPATCEAAQAIIKATAYFTKENGSRTLHVPWHGRVWLNPPYSMPLIQQFVSKVIQEYEAGNIIEAIVLTNNSTDTGWFHELLSRYPVCFTRGRVAFWRPDHDAFGTRQGQAFFYLGHNAERFRAYFSQFGIIVGRQGLL